MDPITLRFLTPGAEAAARGQIFRSSYWIIMVAFSAGVARHMFMAYVMPKYMNHYLLFFPTNVAILAFRWYLHHFVSDDLRAHQLNTWCWFCIILFAAIFLRYLIYLEVFPILDQPTYIMYASTWGFITVLMHAQLFEVRWRLACMALMFAPIASSGWEGGRSVTGNPSFDTLTIVLTLAVGTVFGYTAERMLRSNYLLQCRVHDRDALASDLEHESSRHGFVQVGFISRGGSSEVFLVREDGGRRRKREMLEGHTPSDSNGHRHFALKRIAKEDLKPNRLRMVREEVSIASKLDHPFIVKLFAHFDSNQCVYLVMTYAPGGSICSRLEFGKPPMQSIAQHVLAEIQLAVEYLHGERIIYRDLKPENTLIGESGHVLLADFGVSKALGQASTIHARTQVGTFMYMSPEQRFNLPYSYEADYWAMACMLHEMVSGEFLLNAREEIALAPTLPPLTAAFIGELTRASRQDRLGFGPGGAAKVRAHPYFAGIDFDGILQCERGPFSSLTQVSRLTCDLSNIQSAASSSDASGHNAVDSEVVKSGRRARSPAPVARSISNGSSSVSDRVHVTVFD